MLWCAAQLPLQGRHTLSPVLGVLPADGFQLTPSRGLSLSWRELSSLKLHSLPRDSPHLMTGQHGGKRHGVCTTSWDDSEKPSQLQSSLWDWLWPFLYLLHQISLSSSPHRSHSQMCHPVIFLHSDLHLRAYFPGDLRHWRNSVQSLQWPEETACATWGQVIATMADSGTWGKVLTPTDC